eukprot:688573-Prorocentrum_minimum.AAC.1
MDGVLVTRRPGVAESKLVDNLKFVVDSTNAKIVLSTDWRRTPAARAEVRRILQAHGGMDFIGWTATNTPIAMNHRPIEILNWVRERNKKVKAEGWDEAEMVTNFVAIDDRALLQERGGDRLHGHFVMTHPVRGLTRQACDDVIRLMQNRWVDKVKEPEQQQKIPMRVGVIPRTGVPRNPTSGQKAILEARSLQVTPLSRAASSVTGVASVQRRATGGPSTPQTSVAARLHAGLTLHRSGFPGGGLASTKLATGSGVRGASAIRATGSSALRTSKLYVK